ncbi:MAG TPA: GNAT family N-acetyltransferase [Syntrophobacter fumaroxidans]|nr:GNAT family N-acetyltransferase [Syntrophobacter fumaroxidans]
MKIIVKEQPPDGWDTFIEEHPCGSIYHHGLWQEVITRTYGYRPMYHFTREPGGRIASGALAAYVNSPLTGKRIVAFPFSDSCDPLAADSNAAEALIGSVARSGSDLGAKFVELRFSDADRPPGIEGRPEYCCHVLDLSPREDVLFGSFHKNCVQRAVRSAGKNDIEIVEGDLHGMKEFYRLHAITRRRQGVPVQPFAFFRRLHDTLGPKQMLTVLLAQHHRRVIAGVVILRFGRKAYYKYGASDDRFSHLRANQLLMWEAIRTARREGCVTFDFGRTSLSNHGLCRYKDRWGSRRMPLSYVRIPDHRKSEVFDESSRLHGYLKEIMSRLPLSMIRLSGELFYKHLA